MSELSRLCIVGDGGRERVAQACRRLLGLLDGRADVLAADLDASLDLSQLEADVVVVLGGDGSILAAARRLAGNTTPVLGINFGRLGFLAALRQREMEIAVEEVLIGGRYRVEPRMMLSATVRRCDGSVDGPHLGLNDAVVERWDARSLAVDFIVDGIGATRYRGDGVIVATPTGSTAHSLAAGGPIVEPAVAALVVSPICAHSMSNRPLVLSPDRAITLRVGSGSSHPGLAVDGQVLVELTMGDEVDIRAADEQLHLAVPEGRSYFDVLRNRLQWTGQPPYESA